MKSLFGFEALQMQREMNRFCYGKGVKEDLGYIPNVRLHLWHPVSWERQHMEASHIRGSASFDMWVKFIKVNGGEACTSRRALDPQNIIAEKSLRTFCEWAVGLLNCNKAVFQVLISSGKALECFLEPFLCADSWQSVLFQWCAAHGLLMGHNLIQILLSALTWGK